MRAWTRRRPERDWRGRLAGGAAWRAHGRGSSRRLGAAISRTISWSQFVVNSFGAYPDDFRCTPPRASPGGPRVMASGRHAASRPSPPRPSAQDAEPRDRIGRILPQRVRRSGRWRPAHAPALAQMRDRPVHGRRAGPAARRASTVPEPCSHRASTVSARRGGGRPLSRRAHPFAPGIRRGSGC